MRHAFSSILLLVASATATHAQPAGTHALTVELSNFKFSPPAITLKRGERYHIRFVNRSSGGHSFAARSFFAVTTIAPQDTAKVHKGEVDVAGGDTIEIELVPNSAGTFKVHCAHFMHKPFGMKGEIIVEP